MHKNLQTPLSEETKVFVVSDIHLRLPVTRELGLIQKSLVSRVEDLSKNSQATLVLNGDVLSFGSKPTKTVVDIIEGFGDLTKAIQKFAHKRGHKVLYDCW